ncbi:MAG: HAD family phosphatase [Firmicutes bacterium]|nr:HAD family phosphatase [Bacillota bacterium]
MEIKGAIIDLDGTLLDSTEMWKGAAARYVMSLMKTPEPDIWDETKDMTIPVLSHYLKEEYRIATTEDKIAKGFNTILRENYIESVWLNEYVPIVLEKFKQRGVQMAITTSTAYHIVDEILIRLGIRDYFKYIITTESTQSKEHPQLFRDALDALNTTPENTIVIEDGLIGIRTAKEAGLYVIAMHNEEYADEEPEIRKVADEYIYNFRELVGRRTMEV